MLTMIKVVVFIHLGKLNGTSRSVKVGGEQHIVTIDGYSIPLSCVGGLSYLHIIGKPSEKDLQSYPSVHLTSPHPWDPSISDYVHCCR